MVELVGDSNKPNVPGVLGTGTQFEGVRGISHAANHGAVVGVNDNQSDSAGPGIFGKSKGNVDDSLYRPCTPMVSALRVQPVRNLTDK
jgi:hypothetical protein